MLLDLQTRWYRANFMFVFGLLWLGISKNYRRLLSTPAYLLSSLLKSFYVFDSAKMCLPNTYHREGLLTGGRSILLILRWQPFTIFFCMSVRNYFSFDQLQSLFFRMFVSFSKINENLILKNRDGVLGIRTRAAGWKARANLLSFGRLASLGKIVVFCIL